MKYCRGTINGMVALISSYTFIDGKGGSIASEVCTPVDGHQRIRLR